MLDKAKEAREILEVKCAACLGSLFEIKFNEKVNMVICNNIKCIKYHQPVAVALRLRK